MTDFTTKIWEKEPIPLLDRYKQFSQREAMEHFLSGADPASEIIPGLISRCGPATAWEEMKVDD